MGTWICHLRIAEKMLIELPELDEVAFAFGNLAPDSGLPNADWTQFDPPKDVTHFLRPGEVNEGLIDDLRFYRQHLADLRPNHDRTRHSFALGYFAHLLCDNLWARRIVGPSQHAYADLFARRGENGWGDLKDDWYGLDQRFVRDQRDCLFWRVFLPAPNPPPYLPFIPEAALHQRLDYIRKFYSQPDPAWVLDRPYPYLNEATMTRFVDDATSAILEIYSNIEDGHELEGTALTRLAPSSIEPYPPPLGDEV